MRIMAIDYGDAHTGIAISDPTGLLAGFTTVINSRRQEVVVEQVTLLAKEHGAEELVLGHPVNMDGTLGPRSEKAKAMKVLLEEATALPVVLWDERRTTVSAAAILADNDTFGTKRKERLDSVSAAVILESFLNWRAHHPGEEPPELVRPEQ
mgnify:FL=1